MHAVNYCRMCHSQSQNNLGISLLEQAFESHPLYCKDEDANLLCELYLMEKQCAEVFKVGLLCLQSSMPCKSVFESC